MGKRKTVKFTKTSVSAILDAGQRGEWVDSEASALCLRIQKDGGRPSWSTRITLKNGERPTKTTRRIGCPMTLDYKEARQRALEAQKLAGRGIDPKTWLLEQELGGPIAPPSEALEWSFDKVRQMFIDHLSTAYGPKTRVSYTQAIRYPIVSEVLSGKEISEITRRDLEAVRDKIRDTGKLSQASGCIRTLKTFFTWVEENPAIPLEDSPARGVRPEPRSGGALEINPKKKAADTVPPPDALRNAIKKLQTSTDIDPHQKLAGLLTLYTAQRPLSVASARPEDFEPVEGLDGWLLWVVGHTKIQEKLGLEGHTVLLPPKLADLVRVIKASTANENWMFPKQRKRRKSDSADGYSYESFIGKGFRQAKVGFSPKQVRKGLATHMGRRGFPLSHIKMILHHREGLTDVTSMHYAFHDHQHPKRAVMKAWLDFLEPPQAA